MKFSHSTLNPDAPLAYCSFEAMHTIIEVLFVHPNKENSRLIAKDIEETVSSLETVFSRHIHSSALYQVNTATSAVETEDELFFALELCEQMRMATLGYFDIAALSSSRERPAYRCFPPSHNIERSSDGIILDLGGFAKGYAIEKVKDILKERYQIKQALINFGNSSTFGIGTHPLGDYWGVTPENRKTETLFKLKDSALSISGKSSGLKEHIIDPKTLKYASKNYEIAVTGSSALICEILSTSLYAAPDEKQDEILKSFPGYKSEKI